MMKFTEKFLDGFDNSMRHSSQQLAKRSSRRHFIGKLGAFLVGASALPLLPVLRASAAEGPQEMGDPQSCDYWRYCAFGGHLCRERCALA